MLSLSKNAFLFSLFGLCSPSLLSQTTPLPDPGTRSMEQVWIHPAETPAVTELHQHVEIGYKLRMDERRRIDDYLKGRAVPKALNPFDPQDLSFETLFVHTSAEGDTLDIEKRYGFYYREYERDFSSPTPDDWKHRERNTPFQVRTRFTPQKTGQWSATSYVVIKQTDTVYTKSTTFQVVRSQRPGFLELGESKRFFTQNDETFFPVGQNLPWPTCSNEIDGLCDSIYCAGREAWCHARVMGPYGFEVYEREMAALKNAGANYMRMLIAPWNLEIEFEKLNNYSDRLHCAWETDRILEQAEELGILIHFNLQVHYPLEDPSVYAMFHWDYGDLECSPWDEPYCYFDELNLKSPEEFLRSEEAKRHYQNRLRYLIARYGYSTSVGVFELFSEANNIGNGPVIGDDCKAVPGAPYSNPYSNQLGYAELVGDWQKEMARYIKEDLGHDNHLLAVNYTGLPAIDAGDDSYYSPHIDVMTWNYYNAAISKYSGVPEILDSFQKTGKRSRGGYPFVRKPMLFSEIGPGADVFRCDQDLRWKKAAWTSSLAGCAATAINWNNQHDTLLWRTLGNIHDFMKPIPLDEGNFVGFSDVRKDQYADLIGVRSTEGANQAYGLIHNRTINFYTRWKQAEKGCTDPESLKGLVLFDYNMTARDILPANGGNKLSVNGLGIFRRYTVTYRNSETMEVISKQVLSSGVNGRIRMEHPPMSKDGNAMILFEIKPL